MNTLKRIYLLFNLTFLFLSCKPKQVVQPVIVEDDTYEVVYKSQTGGNKEKSNMIITNYEEFNGLISKLNIDESEFENLLKIDLEKNQLLVCFLGEKTTGGYDIAIENVVFTLTTSEVILKEIVPEKNAMVTSVLTSPYLFVTLPKNKSIIVK